jgi:hypothetical protein
MEAILEQLKTLATTAEGPVRQQLMFALHKIAYSMEIPIDTTLRYGLQVCDIPSLRNSSNRSL